MNALKHRLALSAILLMAWNCNGSDKGNRSGGAGGSAGSSGLSGSSGSSGKGGTAGTGMTGGKGGSAGTGDSGTSSTSGGGGGGSGGSGSTVSGGSVSSGAGTATGGNGGKGAAGSGGGSAGSGGNPATGGSGGATTGSGGNSGTAGKGPAPCEAGVSMSVRLQNDQGAIPARKDASCISVAPTLYGAFFEDINRAGDGGLYAEMVQNRSFEDHPTPLAWRTLDNSSARFAVSLDKTIPLNSANPTSLKLKIDAISSGRVGVFNQGFKGIIAGKTPDTSAAWLERFSKAQDGTANGMVVQAGASYRFSLHARAEGFTGALVVSLESRSGTVLAQQSLNGLDGTWKSFEATLEPTTGDSDARLVLATEQTGTLWFDMVSLFPKTTWKERAGGLRPDLMNMLVAMKPGLLRFPGGSFSEGVVLKDAWKWKATLGDVAERPGGWNIWGYRSTNGLGFHEYLQMAEDLGAEPLYVAHVGMAEQDFVPLDQLEPWVQDVLDAIEYANGPVTSTWGAKRAAAGHPLPFNLKYVEIGNENGMGYSWGGGTRADYLPRYRLFFERIKKEHPEITTIANIHTEPDVAAELVDEHYYDSSDWFFNAATLYDNYDRSKPKVYAGEYATKNDAGNGNLLAALSDAAFLTGLERNADVVRMSSYAPLFTNPNWQKWSPDAIVFDNTRVYGTPAYHVQVMFSANRPDTSLPIERSTSTTLFSSAGTTQAGDLIVKLVNRAQTPAPVILKLTGVTRRFAAGIATTLTGPSLDAENSFDRPTAVAPATAEIPAFTSGTVYSCAARSVTVLRWPVEP